jgi:hypothetical protein
MEKRYVPGVSPTAGDWSPGPSALPPLASTAEYTFIFLHFTGDRRHSRRPSGRRKRGWRGGPPVHRIGGRGNRRPLHCLDFVLRRLGISPGRLPWFPSAGPSLPYLHRRKDRDLPWFPSADARTGPPMVPLRRCRNGRSLPLPRRRSTEARE